MQTNGVHDLGSHLDSGVPGKAAREILEPFLRNFELRMPYGFFEFQLFQVSERFIVL